MATPVRAWTYTTGGYPSSLQLSTTTPPSRAQVKPNHILVRIKAAALNPVDIQIINFPLWNIPLEKYQAEKTLGSDFSGVVIAGGEGSGFKEGDEVFGVTVKSRDPSGGSLGEVAHIDLAGACVLKKPADLSFQKAAGLGCVFLTARTCIESVAPFVEGQSSAGKKKLAVLGGSSACGMYEVWMAKQRGWKVVATCSGRNADFVRDVMGADEIVDYTKEDVRTGVARFEPDAVIDNVGGTECIGLGKRYVSIVGEKTSRVYMGGPLTYYISFLPMQWLHWGLGRLGLAQSYDVIMMQLKKEYLQEVENLPRDKITVDSTYAFEDLKDAYERLNTGRARGKVVIEVSK